MCNSLFYVKALQLAQLFRDIPKVVEARNKDCGVMPLGEKGDGYVRLGLSLPEVRRAIRKEYGYGDCRVRFAFAKKWSDYPVMTPEPRLEIYDIEGKPLMEPVPLHELPEDLSTAVEVELMYVLLLSRGIEISML